METRMCKSCGGAGRIAVGEAWERPCSTCRGEGSMAAPDREAISKAAAGRGGKGLRSKAPENRGPKRDPRAYYVWRMARFHGGRDVTMPVLAGMLVHGDPWVRELDALAEEIAERAFGTSMAAAFRWSAALGGSLPVPAGMPASAYPLGPVVLDRNKPDEERAELDMGGDR